MDSKRSASADQLPTSLNHPVSPPLKKRRLVAPEPAVQEEVEKAAETKQSSSAPSCFPSPFKLIKIRDLPPELNKDCISLKDILGDPLISECWQFNYMHDIDFILSAFDEDVRHLVKLHIVHGFWKREDPSRLALQDAASRHANVTLHAAFMPEMFGTHHSKMMVLFRHDDTAQVVIHTANMILRDWTNMTQAAWLSPRLPLLPPMSQQPGDANAEIGSGPRFKADLLRYLRSYDTRRPTCKALVDRLARYDFSEVRGALIASVPGRHRVDGSAGLWGWPAMEKALRSIPVSSRPAEIAIQISSIATLGPTDTWLKGTFFRALSGGRPRQEAGSGPPLQSQPTFKVVFPTADEIRRSLDGYVSGGSIHTKIASPQQAKQLTYLRPMLCHWANDAGTSEGEGNYDDEARNAGRRRAAPHIKTYIRFSGSSDAAPRQPTDIDWALVTSANLSKQAWGEATTASGEVRVASYEVGVLVWPKLYKEEAVMRATFRTDSLPEPADGDKKEAVVALRMPYSLPLRPYGKAEVPWVATMNHLEPDWMGQVWKVE